MLNQMRPLESSNMALQSAPPKSKAWMMFDLVVHRMVEAEEPTQSAPSRAAMIAETFMLGVTHVWLVNATNMLSRRQRPKAPFRIPNQRSPLVDADNDEIPCC